MPFCPHCGFAVNPSFSFCPSCGNKLSNNFSDTAVPVFTSMRIESSSAGVKGFYEGYALDGKPHVEGKVNWDNGDTYDGEWKNGLKEGFGIYQWKNGDKYQGGWMANKMEGQGELEYRAGSGKAIYKGSFTGGEKNGEGLLLLLDKNGQVTYRVSSESWKNDNLSGPYRLYSGNKYWDFKEYVGWLNGRAVNNSGTVDFFLNGKILISKGKEYYHILANRFWYIIKYFSGSSYLSEVAGVYLIEDNARRAFDTFNRENHLYGETFKIIDFYPQTHDYPGTNCYLVIKTFINSSLAPELVACCSTYEAAKDIMSRRTKINYPSDREWDDEDKCYWHIIESYIMDMPEL